MKRILLALLLLATSSTAWAIQWRAGTGENTILGSSNAADIDYNSFNSIVQPLDNLLATYCQTYLTYTSATTITASAGSCVVSNSQGSIRLFLNNAATTAITSANIDTGSLTASTTYYVYATAASNSATSATYYFSASNTAPSGQTYYFQIGSFVTDSSNQITTVLNNYSIGGYVGTLTSKTAGVNYQALTDGTVEAVATEAKNSGVRIYSDSTATPTTLLTESFGVWSSGAPYNKSFASHLIKKGDYYRVEGYDGNSPSINNSIITTFNFIPTSK